MTTSSDWDSALAETTELVASPSHVTTARLLLSILVPRVADWGYVVFVKGNSVELLVIRAANPGLEDQIIPRLQEAMQDPPEEFAPIRVAHTGRPEFYPRVNEETVKEIAADHERQRRMLALGRRSIILAPLQDRAGLAYGTILLAKQGDDSYSEADFKLAIQIAETAASIIVGT